MTRTEIAPIVVTVLVPQAPDAAFTLFTADIGAWWPLATHSVGEQRATGVTFGGATGEAIVETVEDGSTAVWGTVTAWEPPHRVAFTWHPGRSAEEATDVEVAFAADGTGCRVTLTHSGWARRSDGERFRARYATGWERVLGLFAGRAFDTR